MPRKEKSSEYGLEVNTYHRSYMMTVWFDKHEQSFAKIKERMQALYDGGFVRYACLSKELCPDSGRLHGHLFTRFVDVWSGVKAFSAYGIESGGGWFEEARKDFPSYEYVSCSGHFAEGQKNGKSKPIEFFEIGERPKSQESSKKKDFAACFAMLKDGRPLLEVCAAFPEIALKGFTNLQRLHLLICENKSKQMLSAQYDANKAREELEAKEQEMLHGLKGKEYFLNPHFEPQKASVDDVLKLFS